LSGSKRAAFALVAALSLAADQASKALARALLRPRGPLRPKVIVEGIFELRYGENPGGAFSVLRDSPHARWLFALAAIGGLLAIGAWLWRSRAIDGRLGVALGLLAGGAAGNLADRVLLGGVTDFIVWKIGAHQWPAFNVADASLCAGATLLALDLWPARRPRTRSDVR
jgi:signal peptidase II